MRAHAKEHGYATDRIGEDAGPARFQQMRRAGKRPMRRGEILLCQVGPRLYESELIEYDTAIEPVRARCGAGHDEHVSDVAAIRCTTQVVAPAHALEMIFAVECRDLGVRSQCDHGTLFDTPDQISRHRIRESV